MIPQVIVSLVLSDSMLLFPIYRDIVFHTNKILFENIPLCFKVTESANENKFSNMTWK